MRFRSNYLLSSFANLAPLALALDLQGDELRRSQQRVDNIMFNNVAQAPPLHQGKTRYSSRFMPQYLGYSADQPFAIRQPIRHEKKARRIENLFKSKVDSETSRNVKFCLERFPTAMESAKKIRAHRIYSRVAASLTQPVVAALESLEKRSYAYLVPSRAASLFARYVMEKMARSVPPSASWQQYLEHVSDTRTRGDFLQFMNRIGGRGGSWYPASRELERDIKEFAAAYHPDETVSKEAQAYEQEAASLKSAVAARVQEIIALNNYECYDDEETQMAAEVVGMNVDCKAHGSLTKMETQLKETLTLASSLNGVIKSVYGTLNDLTPDEELEIKGIPNALQRYLIACLKESVYKSLDDEKKRLLSLLPVGKVDNKSNVNYKWLRMVNNAAVWHKFNGADHVNVGDLKNVGWEAYLHSPQSPAVSTAMSWALQPKTEKQYIHNAAVDALILADNNIENNIDDWDEVKAPIVDGTTDD